ncbi:MAG: sugar phosphate isomerase/epimerase [Planctomycetes bacterium]|nr:sugar phosphate isomerase/epimerase [Planctomycetota bacterium]
MKFGVHSFIWTSQWNDDSLELIDKAKFFGFNFIEIPLVDPSLVTPEKIKNKLQQTEIDCCVATCLNEKTDLTSYDKDIRRKGIEHLKKCIDVTAEIGARILCGPIYCAFGKKVGRPARLDEWKFAVDSLFEVATFAQQYKVDLGLEPLNRYEEYLINTVEQAKRIVQDIGKPNVKIQLDTYHMNIEEKSQYTAIKETGHLLCHIHLCENDRGIPGTGQCDWEGIFRALSEIGYKGSSAIEGFFTTIPEIAAATCIWRELAPDPDTLACESLKFLKSMAKKYMLI